jgi:hypothetical protein
MNRIMNKNKNKNKEEGLEYQKQLLELKIEKLIAKKDQLAKHKIDKERHKHILHLIEMNRKKK